MLVFERVRSSTRFDDHGAVKVGAWFAVGQWFSRHGARHNNRVGRHLAHHDFARRAVDNLC